MTQKETKGPALETHILMCQIFTIPGKDPKLQQSFTLINEAKICFD